MSAQSSGPVSPQSLFFLNSRVPLQMMLTERIDLTSGRDLHAPHVLLFLFSIFFGLMPFMFLENLLPFTLPILFSFTIKNSALYRQNSAIVASK